MLLDSDDVLAPDAARTLLQTAVAEQAEVVAGVCVRRELPASTDTPWQRDLFPAAAPRPAATRASASAPSSSATPSA
ncbi:hypothetical protein ACFQ1I_20255 [Kitasatospora arboriphila]